MIAYDLLPPSSVTIFPRLISFPLQSAEWWNEGSRWPIKRRHVLLVTLRICHYDGGDVHSGRLHCFCGEHEQGVEYGRIPRIMGRSNVTAEI